MFYTDVIGAIQLVLQILALGVTAWATIHCLRQRSDAFTAIGTLPKAGWLVILILGLAVIAFLGLFSGFLIPFGLIFFGAALFYFLDVRAGIKELLEGRW